MFGLLMACGVGYKPGLGASQLAETSRPHARVVEYLAQTSADPRVCDLRRTDGVALPFADRRTVGALFKGLERGRIARDRWASCVLLLWGSADPALQHELGLALFGALQAFVDREDSTPIAMERARGLQQVLDRRLGSPLAMRGVGRVAAAARTTSRRLGPDTSAGALFSEIADALDAELGLWEGRRVGAETIAEVESEHRLERWARRLPEEDLRRMAGRRLVQRRIEGSPFTWVRDHADEVRSALRTGRVFLPETTPILAADWRPVAGGTAMLRLLQEPLRGVVRLLPAGRDGTRSADPSLDLVGTLWVTAEGFEQPLTVCVVAAFDPTPCVPPSRLSLTHHVAELAPTGRLRFPRKLSVSELLELGSEGDRLRAQVVVGGAFAWVDLPIVFDSVPDLFLQGVGGHGNGPPIAVEVWELSNDRMLIEAKSSVLGKKIWRGLVESEDAAFHITSYGSPDGADVGRGGDISIRMHCTGCPAVRRVLRRMVVSGGAAPGRVRIREVKRR